MLRAVVDALKAVGENAACNAFAVVFLLSSLLYRVALATAVVLSEAPPFGVKRGAGAFFRTLSGLGHDVLILVIALCLLALAFLIFARHRVAARARRFRIFATLLIFIFVFWNTMITGSHFNLLFTMNTGFTWGIFMEFFTILSIRDFLHLMTLRDYVTVIAGLALFFLLLRTRRRFFTPRKIGLMWAGSLLILAAGQLSPKGIPDELVLNPHEFFLRDAARSMVSARRDKPVKSVMGNQVYLSSEEFSAGRKPAANEALRARVEANIVVVILESTAREYIFDTTKYADGKMPMPYLYSLAGKSLYAANHFASNNSSPRSIFSIFSGLYESPETRFYSMERNLRIPHLVDFVGAGYEHFLVTPADLNWYFPKDWFKNRGFTRLYDYHALKQVTEYKAGPTAVRDEFQTVDVFLATAAESSRPFIGVYYTFVGHWPYPDLSAEHKLIPANSSRSRYINNLYAQDQVIERIVTGFEKSGKLDHTIFVFVGDHGEAFYQHPGNRVHSGESYNENIASPLIIYSPRLIKPQRIEYATVHADILPTLLDTMGVSYDARRFQGESLLRGKPARNYIFTYGNENTLTSVSAELSKVQIQRTAKSCRSFDLRRDPREEFNRGCEPGSGQYRALETFFRVQPGLLRGYNELCNKSGC